MAPSRTAAAAVSPASGPATRVIAPFLAAPAAPLGDVLGDDEDVEDEDEDEVVGLELEVVAALEGAGVALPPIGAVEVPAISAETLLLNVPVIPVKVNLAENASWGYCPSMSAIEVKRMK